MASGRSRSVTFAEDGRSIKSDNNDGEDYFGEPSDDDEEDEEAVRMQNDEDLSLLEQLLNKRGDTADGLSHPTGKTLSLGTFK